MRTNRADEAMLDYLEARETRFSLVSPQFGITGYMSACCSAMTYQREGRGALICFECRQVCEPREWVSAFAAVGTGGWTPATARRGKPSEDGRIRVSVPGQAREELPHRLQGPAGRDRPALNSHRPTARPCAASTSTSTWPH